MLPLTLEAAILLAAMILIAAGTAMLNVPAALIVTGLLLLLLELMPAGPRARKR